MSMQMWQSIMRLFLSSKQMNTNGQWVIQYEQAVNISTVIFYENLTRMKLSVCFSVLGGNSLSPLLFPWQNGCVWQFLKLSKLDNPTVTPTSCSDWPGVWKCESKQNLNVSLTLSFFQSSHTYYLQRVSAMPWVPSRRDCLKEHTIIPICTFHCISPHDKRFTPTLECVHLHVDRWHVVWAISFIYLVKTLKMFWSQCHKSATLLFF